jgi:hypothetical protein
MCFNRLIDQFIYSFVNPILGESMLNIECVIVSLCEKFYRLVNYILAMVLKIAKSQFYTKHDLLR